MKRVPGALLLAAGLALSADVHTPVGFDSRGSVRELSQTANRVSGAFPQFSGFLRIVAWQADSLYLVEVYHADGSRTPLLLTPAEFAAARQRVDAALAARKPGAVNQEGRGSFLLQQIPLALGYYAPAMLWLAQPSDARLGTSLYLLTAAAGYGIPLGLTWHLPMSTAQASLSAGLGWRAGLTAVLVRDLFTHDLPVQDYSDTPFWMLLASIGGQVGGYQLARPLSTGQASYIMTLSDFGAGDGILFSLFVQQFYNWPEGYFDPHHTENDISTFAGQVGGAWLGHWLAQSRRLTDGQADFIRTTGILGALLPNGLYFTLAGPNLDRRWDLALVLGLGIAGNVAATWWADRYIQDVPLTLGNNLIVVGASISGGLLGAGIGFLATPMESEHQPQVIAGLATAGTAAGYWGGLQLARTLSGNRAQSSRLRLDLNLADAVAAAAGFARNRAFSAPGLLTLRF